MASNFKFALAVQRLGNFEFLLSLMRGFADDTRDVKIVGMIREDLSLR